MNKEDSNCLDWDSQKKRKLTEEDLMKKMKKNLKFLMKTRLAKKENVFHLNKNKIQNK